MSPSYIDRNTGKIIHIPGKPKPPMTQDEYRRQSDQIWKLESLGGIRLEDALTSLHFLQLERDAYSRTISARRSSIRTHGQPPAQA